MKMKPSNSTIELLVISIITIVGTFIFAYMSYVIITDSFPESFISIWNTWDTQHYIKIAKHGYSTRIIEDRHLLIVFFPLFPLLTKVFSFVFQNYLLSGLIVSNISYLIAVFLSL